MSADHSLIQEIDEIFSKVIVVGKFGQTPVPKNAAFDHIKELLTGISASDTIWEELVSFRQHGMQKSLKIPLAHVALFVDALPFFFDKWDLVADIDGRSMPLATLAVILNKLPASFRRWEIADNKGWTVAHAYAAKQDLPASFTNWQLATLDGITVQQVHELRIAKG